MGTIGQMRLLSLNTGLPREATRDESRRAILTVHEIVPSGYLGTKRLLISESPFTPHNDFRVQ